MAYRHGVYGSEVPTSLVPMTQVSAGLPVVFGTAPLHLATDPAGANQPKLCYTYKEAVEMFGYSKDWDKYSLCEFMYSQFSLFNMAPVVLVNVLDPAVHKTSVTLEETAMEKGVSIVKEPVMLNTLCVYASEAGQQLTENVDYTAAYNDDEELVITAIEGGAISAQATIIYISYDKLNPAAVDDDDIIGGVDISTGDYEGLELVNAVFPKFGLVPGIIAAPGYSHKPAVAAVMKAKTTNINGHFEAICVCDADVEACPKYSDVSSWKNLKNYTDPYQVLCWPMVALGGVKYHMSTQWVGVCCKTDATHSDIPYKSPSNESLQADSALNAEDKEIILDTATAAYLNGQGVITALNFIGGWKLWGNRTCAYPSNTDVKDSLIAIRRMFNYINNTLITTFWSKVDDPTNKRLIRTIVDSANIWLNGLTAREFILGGRVEFREEDNTTTDLMDGIVRFHVFVCPASPAREIEFIQEYDPSYIATLFE